MEQSGKTFLLLRRIKYTKILGSYVSSMGHCKFSVPMAARIGGSENREKTVEAEVIVRTIINELRQVSKGHVMYSWKKVPGVMFLSLCLAPNNCPIKLNSLLNLNYQEERLYLFSSKITGMNKGLFKYNSLLCSC